MRGNGINRNIMVWFILVTLTSMSMISHSRVDISQVLLILMVITVIKVSLIAYEFMELKKAHKAWFMTVVAIMIISTSIICILH